MTNLDTRVGKAIYMAMWDQHISQTAMAPKLGIGQSALSKKLRGERPWTLDELYRAADALGCEVTDFLPINEYDGPTVGCLHSPPLQTFHLAA